MIDRKRKYDLKLTSTAAFVKSLIAVQTFSETLPTDKKNRGIVLEVTKYCSGACRKRGNKKRIFLLKR